MAADAPRDYPDVNNSQDWEVISIPEETHIDENPYIHFQLNSWLGRFSFTVKSVTVRSTTIHSKNTTQSIANKQQNVVFDQEQSHLFRLPPEIRLYIYELLFRMSTPGHGLNLRRSQGYGEHSSVLASLLTCQRFKNEAEHLFYSLNRLFVEDPPSFWTTLEPQRREAITSIAIPAQSATSLFEILKTLRQIAPNLKSLHIVRKMSVKFIDPRSWAVMAPQIISEIKGMGFLEDVRFITPEARELDGHDLVNKRRLEGIDGMICGAAPKMTV